jgi:membrane-bound lytic murein transglycosylase
MKNRIIWLNCILAVAILFAALAGCASVKKSNATDTENLLAASGFRMKQADTPEKLEHLKTLTQRKVVPQDRNGTTYYIYADAEFCKCLYAGNEEAYQKFRNLSEKQNIAEMNENAAMDWGMWGPWPGW